MKKRSTNRKKIKIKIHMLRSVVYSTQIIEQKKSVSLETLVLLLHHLGSDSHTSLTRQQFLKGRTKCFAVITVPCLEMMKKSFSITEMQRNERNPEKAMG